MFIFQMTLNPPPQRTQSGVTIAPAPGPLAPPPSGGGAPAPLPPRGVARFINLETLAGQFAGLVLLGVILAVVGLVASFLVLNNAQKSYTDVVINSAPSIIAAQGLGQAVENADAAAANYQLFSRVDVSSPDYNPQVYSTNNSQTCKSGLRACSYNDYLTARQQVNDELYQARANITYRGEADAVNAITVRFLDYTGRIEVMKHELDLGHREAALAAYKSAHDILVGNLNNVALDAQGHSPEEQQKLSDWNKFDTSKQYLGVEANVHKLYQINKDYLDASYNDTFNSLTLSTILVVVCGVLLVIGLAFLVFRYAVITHRVINPGYALALIGAIALTVVLLLTLIKTKDDFKTIGSDSFSSIEAASQARQVLADANADESRLLLSPEGPGLDSTNPALTSDIRLAFSSKTLGNDFTTKTNLLNNALIAAWNNITYAGEAEALCKIERAPASTNTSCTNSTYAYTDYLNIDKQLRQEFSNNTLAAAISLDTSSAPGGSDEAFTRFDNALVDLSNVNAKQFDASACNAIGQTQFGNSCSGSGYLPTLQIVVLVVFPLIALAAIGGYVFARREF